MLAGNCSVAMWKSLADVRLRTVKVYVPMVPFESLVFATVPEPRTVKNRIHWDVETRDVTALLDRGATLLRGPDDEIDWSVLADPEGNEFCVMKPRE